ncbi:gamma subclass chorismate mutase AroQ [Pseudomonas sichuanensis]|uniref:gamma subclass chorismate mutase AroQ n=1 Tax=Pseudomonas sichuanensis TaxID=2213015 RepID=UPI00244D0B50|nr:gamma subclass chorismate mutase AroQ [Pseudomonas sichuanensis]MDH0733627.1 gamma subclass chorismate mutase AroQ [Pseudomonas sichuanensis]MDH1582111.1 gamma subclass chorismate mutase AroQ [Pseudomonas sichuanensis]MDH1595375.1 gamma subclass chorismate mutase AroQ [Pseudomonas sichuanensis]MDH1596516.1 gamma subclass chorismate mutase AroQ [Pseudomonas sichuanensis]
MRTNPALLSLCLTFALPGYSACASADETFNALLGAIEQRLDLARSVARHKWHHDLPVQASEREHQILAQVRSAAPAYNLSPERAEAFFSDQIEASKLVQYALLDRWAVLGPHSKAPTPAGDLRPRLDKLQASLLLELGRLDPQRLTNCPATLAKALASRTIDPLRHLALIRATGQLCNRI